jgi:hypothetical protein
MTDFFTTTLMAGDDADGMIPKDSAMRDDTSSDSEENGPRKRRLHGHKKKTRKEVFAMAVKELDGGGTFNFCMAITGFIIAIGCSIFGIFTPFEKIDGTYRSFAVMASVFMMNQSFLFVKTIRDGEVLSMKDHHGRVAPEYHFLQGALPYELAPHRAVCFGCLLLSICALAYGVAVMDAKRHTQLFLGLSFLYVLSSSLNLGWILRDKFEAEVWKAEEEGRSIGSNKVECATRNMVKVLANMQSAMKLMFAFCGAMAVTITIYAIIDFGVKEKGVGLISAGIVFSIGAAWSMAQALNEEGLQDDAQKVHRAATVVFFLLAAILTIVGLVEMEISLRKRIVIGLGVLIILDSTLNFAKVVYRISHVKKIVKKIKKGFHLDVNMDDTSGTFLDRALDTFATTTDRAGYDDSLPRDYVYSAEGPPPPPMHDNYGHGGQGQSHGYEPMY